MAPTARCEFIRTRAVYAALVSGDEAVNHTLAPRGARMCTSCAARARVNGYAARCRRCREDPRSATDRRDPDPIHSARGAGAKRSLPHLACDPHRVTMCSLLAPASRARSSPAVVDERDLHHRAEFPCGDRPGRARPVSAATKSSNSACDLGRRGPDHEGRLPLRVDANSVN
jgi:hypothetical protein